MVSFYFLFSFRMVTLPKRYSTLKYHCCSSCCIASIGVLYVHSTVFDGIGSVVEKVLRV